VITDKEHVERAADASKGQTEREAVHPPQDHGLVVKISHRTITVASLAAVVIAAMIVWQRQLTQQRRIALTRRLYERPQFRRALHSLGRNPDRGPVARALRAGGDFRKSRRASR
jgi:hypothetical protein